MRHEILKAKDISPRIKKMIAEEVQWLTNHPESTSETYESILTDSFPLDDKALDKLFDTPADKFQAELDGAVLKLYKDQEKRFTPEVMRKVERDIYLQVLDNLWMQHLENMDHLREGIHWISVGQRDPLVEYRRQGQKIFDEMQAVLRHEIIRSIAHAQPIDAQATLSQTVETELTRAAQGSVDNAGQITEAETYQEVDFSSGKKEQEKEARLHAQRKRARKAERQRKKKSSRKNKKK